MKYIAIDLGLGAEPTSLVVIEAKTWEIDHVSSEERNGWVDTCVPYFRMPDGRLTKEHPPAPVYHLRHIERMPAGTSYPEIVEKTKAIHAGLTQTRKPILAIDTTGAGKAATDLFTKDGLSPFFVTITAGDEVIEAYPSYKVPKKDLVATAMVALQTERLKIAKDLRHGPLLMRELQTFRMNLDLKKTDESLSWRERVNDDLVLALATGLWIAKKHDGIPRGISYMKPKRWLIG